MQALDGTRSVQDGLPTQSVGAREEDNDLTCSQPTLIVGTGAMACLFASRLLATGVEVTMVGHWDQGLQALHSKGVRVVGIGGEERSFPVRALSEKEYTESRDCGAQRCALVLVKAWQTKKAAQLLSRCLHREGIALTLQNGLGNREVLEEALGPARVAVGSTTAGANMVAPGVVRIAGEGVTTLGVHPRLDPITGILREAGFLVEVAEDIESLLWGKLVINLAINPLTALLGIPNGALLEIPQAREILTALAQEGAAVAAARGVRLPYPDAVAAAESTAQRTSRNISSMLQDLRRGAPTEVDAICGPVVQAGEKSGVPVPVTRAVWRLVQARTAARIEEISA